MPVIDVNGFDTNPSGTFTFRQCARDVLALLDHLGPSAIKAIGMSLGAKTLLHVADRAPTRARGDGARQWVNRLFHPPHVDDHLVRTANLHPERHRECHAGRCRI
jgi:pimeloyl-ACP methyl ester carboxylesterase